MTTVSEIMEPKISVIIPCYNRADLIAQAINSVMSQTYARHEIIIVDDNSSDNLLDVLAQYRDKIVYVKKCKNEGVSAARNDGLRVATGEYISFLDSDDVWLPNKSRVQAQALLSHSDVGMAVGGCEYIDANGKAILKPTLPDEHIGYEDLCIYTAIPGSASNVLIRKTVFDNVGNFDVSLHSAEDRDLWVRIAEKYKIYSCAEITARVRIHDAVRQNRSFNLMLTNRRTVNRKIKSPGIKRKADAWMYFHAYRMQRGNPAWSIYFLLLSFVCYPFRIHKKLTRTRDIAERMLSNRIYRLLSQVKRKVVR